MSYRLFDTVSIGVTNECNAKCEFCIVGSDHIETKQELKNESVLRLIESVAKYPSIQTIGFTGGEAFLNYDRLYSYVKKAYECRKSTVIYTNGYWSYSYVVAYEKLSSLKKMGLRLLLVSADSTHQKYVPVENIKILLEVCAKLDIYVKLHAVVDKNTFEATEEVFRELGTSKINASMAMTPAIPCKNVENNHEILFSPKEIKSMHCSYERMAYVGPDGQVYACCLGAGLECFHLGNIYIDDIIDILNRASRSYPFMMVQKKGIGWIAEKVLEKEEIESGFYVNACHLCRRIFSDQSIVKSIGQIIG